MKKDLESPERIDAVLEKVFGKVDPEYLKKKRESCRQFLQSTLIPELIRGVRAGEVPYDELLNKSGWELYINKVYDINFIFEWDELQVNREDLKDGFTIITYKYPMALVEHEHLFSAIIINRNTNGADYYFLEYSKPDEWLFDSGSRNDYHVHMPVAIPDMEEFINWVKEQKKYLM